MAVEVYVPSPSLLAMHGTARVLGVNEITLSGYQDFTDLESPLYQYTVGVLVPALIMVIVFLLWTCALVCQKCCKRLCCPELTLRQQAGNQTQTLVGFTLCCLVSIVAWGVGLQANVNATVGFNHFLFGVQNLEQYVVHGLEEMDVVRNTVVGLAELADQAVLDCSQFGAFEQQPLPFDQAVLDIDQTLSSVKQQVNQVTTQLDYGIGLAVGYLQWREVGTMIVLICLVVLLTLFLGITVLRVRWFLHPEEITWKVTCLVNLSVSYSWIIFLLGVLLLLVAWVFLALIHVLGTLGSDICVPNVDSNLNRLYASYADPTFTNGDPCLTSQDGILSTLCYYQTCQGQDPLENLLVQLPNVSALYTDQALNLTQLVEQALPGFNLTLLQGIDSIDEFNYTALPDPNMVQVFENISICFQAVDVLLYNATTSLNQTQFQLSKLLDCELGIHPLYANVIHSGFCNGFVDGLYWTYVSFLVGAVMMMLAFSVYRVLEFTGEGGVIIPTAVDLDENGLPQRPTPSMRSSVMVSRDSIMGGGGGKRVESTTMYEMQDYKPTHEIRHDFTFTNPNRLSV
ncbi:hypothetical protein BASA81_013271 [Batrachochytrium salamandrivorans]|nr:hypothetical protein BASA81_013271 [Batrachochytrium salamandrivorans]